MAPRIYAVAFRALHHKTKTAFLDIGISRGRSEADVVRRGLQGFKAGLPEKAGWSDWDVIAHRVPAAVIAQVVREARWFDPTGAHRLYCVAIYATNRRKKCTVVNVAHVLSYTEACAKDDVRAHVNRKYPASEGWTNFRFEMTEYAVPRRQNAQTDMRWTPTNVTTH